MTTNALEKAKSGRPAEQSGDPHARSTEGVFAPRVDIVETNDGFRMYAQMPGVKAEDVSLHCKDGELVLHGRCLPRHSGKRCLHQEYGIGDFYRTFALNDLIDYAKIDARMENGILIITLPKREAAKPKRIAVKG